MYKRILTVQDISCFGQCSLTVALPILSAFSHETVILPSSILSTHTMGFKDFTFHDMSNEINKIKDHWIKENITFDSIYTGYLGKSEDVDVVLDIKRNLLRPNSKLIVDPAMADFGHLYPGFDNDYVEKMKVLAKEADIILPNISEACLLLDVEYKEKYDETYVRGIFYKFKENGYKTIILTGVSYDDESTGVVVFDTSMHYYKHRKIAKSYHGTGDVYSSVFVGQYLRSNDLFESAKYAADFTLKCIEETMKDPSHNYGVEFEKLLYLVTKQ